MKTAIVIGATGLVGNELLHQLINDEDYDCIKTFSRNPLSIKHSKIIEHIVDFDNIDQWKNLLIGDVLFSAMGTTIKKAKSNEIQYKIDYTYQYKTALHCSNNGLGYYALVSSAGSGAGSKIFYSRIKGELERDVKQLVFQKIIIVRPGILAGNRTEKRTAEKIGINLAKIFAKIPGLKKYRPIHAAIVAKAMINAIKIQNEQIQTYTLEEVFKLAEFK